MAIPKVLLFDLGGVLVEWAGPRELPKLLAASMDPEDLRVKWATSPAVGQFETGRCSEQEFATAFIDEWGLRVDRDRFLEAFSSWVVGPYAGTNELLAGLRGRYTLACLSNTNATHWKRMLQMDALRPVHERHFLSHELGLMKPSPELYAHVARELGCEPGEIAFFDDGPANVDGAVKAGLSAHNTVGPAELRRVLGDLGLL
jgi:HAD superfamily hydrolase (TIGR01509 family)